MKLIRYGFSGPLVIFLLIVLAETGWAQNSGRQAPSLVPRRSSSPAPKSDSSYDEESLQSFVRRFKRDVLDEQNQNETGYGDNQAQPFDPDSPQSVGAPQYRAVGYPNPNSGLRQGYPRKEDLRSVQDFDPSPAPPQDDNGADKNQEQVPGFNPFANDPNDIFNDNPSPEEKKSGLDPKPELPVLPDQGRQPAQREPQVRPQVRPQIMPQQDSVILPDSRPTRSQSDSPSYQPQQMDYLPNYNFHGEPNASHQTPHLNYSQSPQQGEFSGLAPDTYGPNNSYGQTPHGYSPQILAPSNQTPYNVENGFHHPHSGGVYGHDHSGHSSEAPQAGSEEGYFAAGRRQGYSGIAGQEFLISDNCNDGDCGFECELPIFYLAAFGFQTDLKNLVSGSTTLHTNNGGGFGFALGQRQGDNLRMELEYSFRTNDIDGATSLTGLRDLTGKVKAQAGMANVYWEMVNFPSCRLKPYFGAGLGFARMDSEVFDSLALPVTLGRTKDSSFAHQFIAGLNFKGFRNMDLFVEYRIFNADPFQVQNAGLDRYDYETTNLGGGLRWKF